jgi:simple sugar transport system ATP-binding protein
VLSARGIVKRFPGVVANDGVDLDVAPGEVHVILGENGAGKTTLASVLSGLYRPDAGEVRIDGDAVTLRSPRDALACGIGMVHQHTRLVERFTVAENLALGDASQPMVLDRARLARQVAELSERFSLPVDPDARVSDLSVGERQRVELVDALHRGADVLILDEPTAVLTPREVGALFATLRAMCVAGKAVVLVTHKLGEAMEVSDRITVLRRGRVVGAVRAAATDRRDLVRMMIGREVDLSPRRAVSPPTTALLSVRDLVVGALDGLDLDVRGGEIVGVAGVAGNGQRELVEAIAGLRAPSSGRIEVGGVDVTGRGPRAARRAGLAFVPDDRLGTGLSPSLSIADNVRLTRPRRFLTSRRRAASEASELMARFAVEAPGPEARVATLSGGNAQRLLLARELTGGARVLVVYSPTRGLDVAATGAVRDLLDAVRRRGDAVLLVSEDLDEVVAMSDRLVVLYRGRITHETTGDLADVGRLGDAMAGVA